MWRGPPSRYSVNKTFLPPASYVLISTQVSRGEGARGWETYFFVPEPPQLPLKGLTPNLFP